jgi:hypothetical protein
MSSRKPGSIAVCRFLYCSDDSSSPLPIIKTDLNSSSHSENCSSQEYISIMNSDNQNQFGENPNNKEGVHTEEIWIFVGRQKLTLNIPSLTHGLGRKRSTKSS